MTAFAEIDREIDALGAPPADVAALLARYGEAERGLAHIDEALDALGRAVELATVPSADERISVDVASVGSEGDALPAALGEEIEIDVPVSEPPPEVPPATEASEVDFVAADEPAPPATLSIPADPLAAQSFSPPAPDPKVRAQFEALFEDGSPAAEPVAQPTVARDSTRPREELDRLLDQEIDPSEFPRASDSVTPAIDVVEDVDSSMEMLVDDDDIMEIDDVDLEEIE